jgi:PKD repeat protein
MKRILLMTLLMSASYAGAQLTLSTNPVSGEAPLSVTFKATCTTCVAYTWSFGDNTGQTVPGPNQTHVYKAAGIYFVIVAAVDSKGTGYNAQATIKVAATVDPENRYCGVGNIVLGPASDGPAKLPQKCLNTSLANTPSPGSVVSLATGGNLQAAYNALKCGQTLSLAHGATWVGPFTFGKKSCTATNWITIKTDGTLPPVETRVTAADLPQLATISMKPNSSSNKVTGDHIRFVGIAWLKQAGGPIVDFVDVVGANNIIFDRNYAHGNPKEETRRFLSFSGGNYIGVVDSWVDEMHCIAKTGTCVDAQAVAGGGGSVPNGVWKIVNNYLSAAAETIIFGGSAATVTPCDIEVRSNYMFKPMSWNPVDPSFIGTQYIVKNLFELKNTCRLLLEGNVLQNVWGGFSQTGFSILIGPKNQAIGTGNVCPLCYISDITVRYNASSTSASALQIGNAPSGNNGWAAGGHNYSIHDDVFDNLQYAGCYQCGPFTGQIGSNYQSTNPPPVAEIMHDVLLNHLTLVTVTPWPVAGFKFATGMLNMSGPPAGNTAKVPQMTNITYENSLFASGVSGFYPTGGGADNCSWPGPSVNKTLAQMISACWVGTSLFSGNVVVAYPGASAWPAGNWYATSWSAVGLTNYNNGSGGNYSLTATSPFKGKALDGKDPGADIGLVSQYTKNVVSGVQQ